MAGGVFTGANPGYVARELAYQLKDSGARFLICADAALELGVEAAESIGLGRERVFVFDDLVMEGNGGGHRLGVRNWKVLVESEGVGRGFEWVDPRDPKEDVCCLNYSSGTTGVPKVSSDLSVDLFSRAWKEPRAGAGGCGTRMEKEWDG